MDGLNSLVIFVHVADKRSFSSASRLLGLSSSAIGKSIARLEHRLGVRLFHRSTRSITLTAEGSLFLQRCRRIIGEMEAAKQELAEIQETPSGRLRVGVPLVSPLITPVLIDFMLQYPEIRLDLDCTDRVVDVIEEGFDIVIRTGKMVDSRLVSRQLGIYHLLLVGSPAYFSQYGIPETPIDLMKHACLLHRFPETGKFEPWPILDVPLHLPETMICSTTDCLVDVAKAGLGIACLPDFMVRSAVLSGQLHITLEKYTQHSGEFRALWPASKYTNPKLRVFIDFVSQKLFPATH